VAGKKSSVIAYYDNTGGLQWGRHFHHINTAEDFEAETVIFGENDDIFVSSVITST